MEYEKGAVWTGGIAWVLTFLGTWIWCAANYGFLLGFGLGWLPSAILATIVAVVAAILWPIIVLGLIGLGLWIVVALQG